MVRHVSCACQEMRRTSPQPFAPGGKCRFARVRGARQSLDCRRPRPRRAPVLSAPVRRLAGANCAALGTGAFDLAAALRSSAACPSVLVRPPHPPDAGHAASAEYRLRTPGLAPAARMAARRTGSARPLSGPRLGLRAISPCVSLLYGASLTLAPTLGGVPPPCLPGMAISCMIFHTYRNLIKDLSGGKMGHKGLKR